MVEVESDEAVAVVGGRPLVVVGIPAFNEEKTIARVVLGAQKYASRVIVCDDGSTDLTAKIAERLGAEVVQHERNLGYGAAIRSLFKTARALGADVLITLDGDGQHDPEEIPDLVRPVVEGSADVVIGSRFVDDHGSKEMPLYRQVGAKVITKMVNGSAKNGIKDAQSGLRAYSHQALKNLVMLEDGMGVSVEILLEASKHGLKICEVPSLCHYANNDGVGTSTENPVKHGLGVVTSVIKLIVEDKPLTMLGVPGILCMVAGVFFSVWMLQIYAVEHRIVTNIALACIASVLIGFFCLSVAITLYAISRLARKMNKDHE